MGCLHSFTNLPLPCRHLLPKSGLSPTPQLLIFLLASFKKCSEGNSGDQREFACRLIQILVNFFKGNIGIFPSPSSMKSPTILTGCR